MNINVSQVLEEKEVILIKNYLTDGKLRSATLVLFQACTKNYENVNPDELYQVCWKLIQSKANDISPLNGRAATSNMV